MLYSIGQICFCGPGIPPNFTCPLAYAAKRFENSIINTSFKKRGTTATRSRFGSERQSPTIYRLSLKEKRIGPRLLAGLIGNLDANVLDAARQFIRSLSQCFAFGGDDALSTTALRFEHNRLCR